MINCLTCVFVVAVSLTGEYSDMKYVGNFPNCAEAEAYYESNCKKAKAMTCLAEEHSTLGIDYESKKHMHGYDNIIEPNACGFVGVIDFKEPDDNFTTSVTPAIGF